MTSRQLEELVDRAEDQIVETLQELPAGQRVLALELLAELVSARARAARSDFDWSLRNRVADITFREQEDRDAVAEAAGVTP